MNQELFIAMLIETLTMVPVVVLLASIPYLTRRTESFGVSIPKEVYADEELVQMRKQFVRRFAGGSAVLLVAGLLLMTWLARRVPVGEGLQGAMLTALPLLVLALHFGLYLHYHFRMKWLKAERQWQTGYVEKVVVDTRFREQPLRYSNFWLLPSIFVMLLTVGMTVIFWDRIPEKVPMQYNFSGQVTNWADKSWGTMSLFPLFQLGIICLMGFVNWTIGLAKQQLDPDDPETSRSRNVIFRRRWSAFLIWNTLLITLLFFYAQLTFIVAVPGFVTAIISSLFAAVVLVWTLALSFRTGQGGSRVRVKAQDGERLMNRDDDRYWKLGQFYFNPDDPALFLEKRFGIGFTLNFARPAAWLFLLLILGLPLGILMVSLLIG